MIDLLYYNIIIDVEISSDESDKKDSDEETCKWHI